MKNKLNRSQQLIIDTLNEEEALTYEELANTTGLSYDGVRGRVSELKQMGYSIERMRDGANTFLMYKAPSTYRRPLDIKDGVSQKIKAIDDFYKITDFLDDIKKQKAKKVVAKQTNPSEDDDRHAVLLLSDLHFGEVIWSPDGKDKIYDTDIAHIRLEDIGYQVIDQLKKEKINHVVILGLGDMVDGDSIYRNHLFRVEKPAVEQVQDAVKGISAMIKSLVASKITVEMFNVRGNHGITNYKNLEEDNWDNVVYDMLEIIFADNENVDINNSRANESAVEIGETTIVISHGQNMNNQIKTASGLREFRGMCNKHRLEVGDIIVIGHLHEFGIESDQGRFLIRNGSVADASEYAYKLNLFSEPMQTLMIVEDGLSYPKIIPLELGE